MYQWIKEGENKKNLMLLTPNFVRAGCTSDIFITSGIAPLKAVNASDRSDIHPALTHTHTHSYTLTYTFVNTTYTAPVEECY